MLLGGDTRLLANQLAMKQITAFPVDFVILVLLAGCSSREYSVCTEVLSVLCH